MFFFYSHMRISLIFLWIYSQPLPNQTRFTFTYRDASGRYYITSKKLPIKPLESFTVKPDSNITVEGLSFDFIVYNVIGFLCYSIFNIGLYFIPLIQEEYFKIYPLGVIPVQLNDLFFSVHALVITLVVVVQCFLYESAKKLIC
ncbi:hypothetical protein ACTXT7_016888 [Hymenolepis weldensis]